MKVRDLIADLINLANLDDDVEIYVCSKTDAVKEFLVSANESNNEWCLDEILQIDEVEDRGGHIWLKAEEIV